MEGCGRLGMPIVVATPKEYQFSADEISEIKREVPQLNLTVTEDPAAAVKSGDRRLHRRLGQHGHGSGNGKTQKRLR